MIRALNAKDAERMAEIHAGCFFKGWDEADMWAHIHKDLCFGFGRPLDGFIIIKSAADQAEILTVATDPSERRRGIARALLEISETELAENGVDTLFLEVAEDNKAAISFYNGMGFEPIGRRLGYYKREMGRVAAITYRKRLAANDRLG
ncbi:GNAT family N-acetyltransferase [Hellea balneolensis]|uniref:GNAT family N-acetyltransferase n=1 Tax=Hellea balneolensis TaxID=287478 RepID=UPI00041354A6|nr:GNAT family N-acetyltransferase [Hellea balneolensis]